MRRPLRTLAGLLAGVLLLTGSATAAVTVTQTPAAVDETTTTSFDLSVTHVSPALDSVCTVILTVNAAFSGVDTVNVPVGWSATVTGQVITWSAQPGNCLRASVADVNRLFGWRGTAPATGGTYNHAWQTIGGAASGNVSTLVNEPVLSGSTKSVTDLNGAPLRPGDTVRYVLTIRNTGNMTATGVSVADTLPAVFASVSGVTGGGSVTSGPPIVITWAVGALNAGTNQVLQFDATLNTPLANGTAVSNRATVRSDQTNPATTAPAALSVTSAPLFSTASKGWTDLNGGLVQPGDTLTYTMVVPNTGDMHATGVTLTDALPTFGIDYVPGSTTLNGTPLTDLAGVSRVVSGLLINSPGEPSGTINVGESATVTVWLRIRSDASAGTTFTNSFSLSSTQGVTGTAAAPPATVLGAAHTLLAQFPATASTCDELECTLRFVAGTSVAFDNWIESVLATGFDYVPGSTQVTNSGQAGLDTADPAISGATLRFNYSGAPNPGNAPLWDVAAGDTLNVVFRVKVAVCAPGSYGVTSSANFRAGASAPYTLLTPATTANTTVLEGSLTVTKTPVAPPAALNDIITYTIRVKSVGFGAVGNVSVTDSLRTGLRLVPGLTVPAPTSYILNADSTTSIVWGPEVGQLARLAPGEEQVITLAVRLVRCTDYDDIVTARWGCEAAPCQVKTATASVNLLLNEPRITFSLNPSPISVPSCDTTGVSATFTVTNTGGEARDMDIFMNGFPAGLAIVDVSGAGYTPGLPVTFNVGTLLAGESRAITFRVRHIDNCGSPSGTLVFTTRYTNLCGDPYTFTALIGSVSTQGQAGVTLTKSGPIEILAGTTDSWTIQACFGPGLPADTVWVTDSYPAGLTFVGNENPPAFTGGGAGAGSSSWFFLPADFAATGCVTITYSLTATGSCNSELTNSASATTRVPCGVIECVSTAGGSALTAIDCPDNTGACVTTLVHTVNNAPQATEEVCLPVTHRVTATFPANPPPGFDFADLTFKAQARHGKTLVGYRQLDGTWAYGKARFRFTDSLGRSCELDLEPIRDGNNELSWDLAPLDDLAQTPGCEFGAPPVLAGGTLLVTYDLVSDDPIAYHYEFARLVIDGGVGFPCNGSVEEPVQLTVTRATMSVGIGLSATVAKCVAMAVPISVGKSGAYGSYDNVLYLSTEGWEYIDDPSDPGYFLPLFAGGLPNVGLPTRVSDVGNGTPGVMWKIGDLPAGFVAGTITVPLRRSCPDVPAYARLVYDDRCANDDTDNIDQNSLVTTATATPALVLAADVTLKLTPLTNYVTADTALWTLYCINGGAGAVERLNIRSSTPGNGLQFLDVRLLDQSGTPRPGDLEVEYGPARATVDYRIAQIPAGETWRILIRAAVSDCDNLIHDVSGWWGCDGDTCQSGPQLTQRGAVAFPPATVIADIVGAVNVASCGPTTVTTRVKNASLVRVRQNVYRMQLPVGLSYIDNSTTISINHLGGATEPTVTAASGNLADPVVSGQELIWVLENYLSPGFLSPEDEVTIACQLRAAPTFAGGVIDAVGTYADECGGPAVMTADRVPVTTMPFEPTALTMTTTFDSLQACTVAGVDDNLVVLTVANPVGSGTAFGPMVLTAQLPEGLTYAGFSTNISYPTSGGTGTLTTNPTITGTGGVGTPQRLRWTLPAAVQLEGGDDLIVRFRILQGATPACPDPPDGLRLTIQGERCASGVTGGEAFTQELGPLPIALRRPELTLDLFTLDLTPNGVAAPGDTLRATAVVHNAGSGWSRSRTLRLRLNPGHLTFLSAAPAANSSSGGLYTWTTNLPALAPGASDSVRLTVRIQQAVPLGAIVTFDGDITENCCGARELKSTFLTVSGSPHLDIEKFSADAVIVPGGTVTYEIFVHNDGGQTLQNVVVTETATASLPGLSYLSSQFDSTKVSFTGSAAAPAWTIARSATGQPRFYPNATEVIRISYTVAANYSTIGTPAGVGHVYNRATISSVQNSLGTALTGAAVLDTDGERVPVAVPGAALDIQKVAVQGVVEPGALVTFLLSVTNTGDQHLTNVVVTDPVPPGLTFQSAQIDAASTVQNSLTPPTFTIASLPIHGQQLIALTLRASTNTTTLGATVNNTASATGRDQANVVVNATPSTVSLPVQPRVGGLDVDKVATTGTAEPGGTVTYTLTVHNSGAVDLTNVVVTDTPPAGLTYAGSQIDAGVTLNGTAPPTFTIAALPAGSLEQIALTFNVASDPAAVGNPVINTAGASGTDPSGNTVTATTATNSIPRGAPAPALDVAKVALGPALVPGQPVTYLITAQNQGNVPLTNVLITDPVPGGLTYRSSSRDTDVALVTSTPPTFRIAALPAGAAEVFSITFDTPADPTLLANPTQNVVNAQGTAPGGAPVAAAADTALLAVIPAAARLELSKVATTGVVVPGGTVTWQLHLRNTGVVDLNAVTVTDTPPAGLTLASVEFGAGVSQTSAAPPTFLVASLPAGAGTIISLTFDVTPDGTILSNPVVNSASASGSDPGGAPVTVGPITSSLPRGVPERGLDIRKVATESFVTPDGALSYLLTVTNTGEQPLTDVDVVDLAPAGLTYAYAQFNAATVTQTGVAPPAWRVASLAPHAAEIITVTFTTAVNPDDMPDPVVNRAWGIGVDPSGASVDADTTACSVPQRSGGPRVDIEKSALTLPLTAGNEASWLLTVLNAGGTPLTNLSVSDILPSGLTYLAADPPAVEAPVGTLTWTLADLSPGQVRQIVVTTLVSPTSGASITNSAGVTATAPGDSVVTDSDLATAPVRLATSAIHVEKTPTSGFVVLGGQLTYILTVSNDGEQPLTTVSLADSLPQGTVFAGSDHDPTRWSQVSSAPEVRWNLIGALEPGRSEQLTLNVNAAADLALFGLSGGDTTLVNAARASGTDPQGAALSDRDEARTAINVPRGAVLLNKTATVGEVVPGQQVTYLLTVENVGDQDLFPLEVREPNLGDQGLSFVASKFDSARFDLAVTPVGLIWSSRGAYTPGERDQIRVTYLATTNLDSLANPIINVATAIGNDESGQTVIDSDSEGLPLNVLSAGLSINKSAAQGQVTPGEPVTWTVTVANTGQLPLSSVQVTEIDPTPQGLTLLEANYDSTFWQRTGALTWAARDTLDPGAIEVLRITWLAATDPAALPARVENRARVDATDLYTRTLADSARDSLPVLVPGASLELHKEATAAALLPGHPVTWLLTLTNNGQQELRSVVVTDTLPPGLTAPVSDHDAARLTFAASGARLSWTLSGVLRPGDTETIRLSATASANASDLLDPTVNTATVRAEAADGTPRSDTDSARLPLQLPFAALGVTKIPAQNVIVPGELVLYTLLIDNRGDAPLHDVLVAEAPPAGLAYLSSAFDSARVSWSGSSAAPQWSLAELPVGAQTVIQVRFLAAADPTLLASPAVNRVTATGLDPSGRQIGAEGESELPVRAPDARIRLEKIALEPVVVPGAPMTWELRLTNVGSDTLFGVSLSDNLPAGFSDPVSLPDPARAVFVATPEPTWTLLTPLAPGDLVSVRLTATASLDEQTLSDPVVNGARATGTSRGGMIAADEAEESVPVARGRPALNIQKSTTMPLVVSGQPMAYTITVTNTGDRDLFDLRVEDIVPAGLSFASSYFDAVTVAFAGTTAAPAWTIARLPHGELETITVRFDAEANAAAIPDPVVNRATVRGRDAAGTFVDDADDESTPLQDGAPSLHIDKVATAGSISPGGEVTYILTVLNAGAEALTDVRVDDPTPPGLSYLGSQFDAVHVLETTTAGLPAWFIPRLPVGGFEQIRVTFAADAGLTWPTRIANTARARGLDARGAAVEDSDDERLPVAHSRPAVHIDKSATQGSVVPGEEVTYLLTVTNIGDTPLLSLSVEDTPDVALDFLASNFDNRRMRFSISGGRPAWWIPSLAPGEPAQIRVTWRAAQSLAGAGAPDSVVNRVSVVGGAADGTHVIDTDDDVLPVRRQPASIQILKWTDFTGGASAAGAEVAYHLFVVNTGAQRLTGVTATDYLPPALAFRTADLNPAGSGTAGPNGGGHVTWNIGALEPQEGWEVLVVTQIQGTLAAGTPLLNRAVAAGLDPAGQLVRDADSALVQLRLPRVAIDKSADRAQARPGEVVSYTVTWRNTGDLDARGVVVVDEIPAGTTYVEGSATGGAVYQNDTRRLVHDLGTLPAGSVASLTYQVRLAGSLRPPERIPNAALIYAEEIAPAHSDTVWVAVSDTPLVLRKSVDRAVATAGDTLTYTLAWQVQGASDLNDLVIRDLVPGLTTFLPGSDAPAASFDPVTRELRWTLGGRSAGSVGNVSYRAAIDSDADDGSRIPNEATISASGIPAQSSNEVTTILVPPTRLVIEKRVDRPLAQPGDTLTFTVIVANQETRPARGVILRDMLPPEVDYVPESAPEARYEAGRLSWDLGTLLPGDRREVTLRAIVRPDVASGTQIINVAEAAGAEAGVVQSNAVLTLILYTQIELTKSANRREASVGDLVTYTLTARNSGNARAADLQLDDLLPTGFEYVTASSRLTRGTGTVPIEPTGVVPLGWSLGGLNPGEEIRLLYDVRIGSAVVEGRGRNCVTARGVNASGDSLRAGPVCVDLDVVAPRLVITKTTPERTVEPGELVAYTLTVQNPSRSDVTDARIEDRPPVGFTYARGTARLDGLRIPEPTGARPYVWAIGNLPAGRSVTLEFDMIVSLDAPNGVATNVASVEGRDALGSRLQAGPAEARVTVLHPQRPSAVQGWVFLDCDNDGRPDSGSVAGSAVPGVELVLEDGRRVRTDDRGEYLLYPLERGDHLLRLERSRLPSEVRAIGPTNHFFYALAGGRARVNFRVCVDDREGLLRFAKSASSAYVTRRTVGGEPERFTLGGVLFDTGRATLRPEANGALDQVARRLKELPEASARIEGHTDVRPIRTSEFPDNYALSLARAGAVREALVDRYGIDEARLRATGYGPDRPAAPGSTLEDLQKNRRVEVLIDRPAAPGVEVGGYDPEEVEYRLTLVYAGDIPLADLVVEDLLPAGLSYRAGSSRQDNAPGAEPEIRPEAGGVRLRWSLGDMSRGFQRVITYRVRVDSLPPERVATNEARVRWRGGSGEAEATTPVGADLRLGESSDVRSVRYTLDGVLFDTGKADLRPAAAAVLRRIVDALRGIEAPRILVEGHTDDRPIRQTDFPDNQALSEARARAVADWLARETGLDRASFEPRGYGPTRPTASNASPAGRQKNRRVEIEVIGRFGRSWSATAPPPGSGQRPAETEVRIKSRTTVAGRE